MRPPARAMTGLATAALVLLASLSAAQFGRTRGLYQRRAAYATLKDFDGGFQFCRVVFRNARGGDGSRLERRLATRRREPVDSPVGALPRPGQHGGPEHAEAAADSPERSDAESLSVRDDDRAGRRLPRRRRSQGPARVLAARRLPVGGRLLGRGCVGQLGSPATQGAAIEHLSDRRRAARPSGVPPAAARCATSRRSRASATGTAATGRRNAGRPPARRTCAPSTTTAGGSWS